MPNSSSSHQKCGERRGESKRLPLSGVHASKAGDRTAEKLAPNPKGLWNATLRPRLADIGFCRSNVGKPKRHVCAEDPLHLATDTFSRARIQGSLSASRRIPTRPRNLGRTHFLRRPNHLTSLMQTALFPPPERFLAMASGSRDFSYRHCNTHLELQWPGRQTRRPLP